MSCSYNSQFNNITLDYACGIVIQPPVFGSAQDVFPLPQLQQCCNIYNQQVKRIPGNTDCDIQWCEVPIEHFGITTATRYSSVSTSDAYGPNAAVSNCISALKELDMFRNATVSTFCSLRTFDYNPDDPLGLKTTSVDNYASIWSSIVDECYTDPSKWPIPANPTPCDTQASSTALIATSTGAQADMVSSVTITSALTGSNTPSSQPVTTASSAAAKGAIGLRGLFALLLSCHLVLAIA